MTQRDDDNPKESDNGDKNSNGIVIGEHDAPTSVCVCVNRHAYEK